MNTPALLSAIATRRILVVGDIMLDHYIWGEVSRISPEAPVPIIHVRRESHTAGGAANVALNLASLGAHTRLIGAAGEDEAGRRLVNLLQTAGVDPAGCLLEGHRSTIVKTRVIARTQQVCRIDHESIRDHYNLDSEANLQELIDTAVGDSDAVILSDYAKGAITQRLVNTILTSAKTQGVMVAIDPKPARRLAFREVGLITPNRHEALELAGLPEPSFGDPYPLEETCRRIHREFAPELLVITLGADGMALCRGGQVEQVLPTEAREVFDVSGAGDTVIATLTAALAAGASPVEAASLANRAAGFVVSRVGTTTVTPHELLQSDRVSES